MTKIAFNVKHRAVNAQNELGLLYILYISITFFKIRVLTLTFLQ